jgi:hypothetical protein
MHVLKTPLNYFRVGFHQLWLETVTTSRNPIGSRALPFTGARDKGTFQFLVPPILRNQRWISLPISRLEGLCLHLSLSHQEIFVGEVFGHRYLSLLGHRYLSLLGLPQSKALGRITSYFPITLSNPSNNQPAKIQDTSKLKSMRPHVPSQHPPPPPRGVN